MRIVNLVDFKQTGRIIREWSFVGEGVTSNARAGREFAIIFEGDPRQNNMLPSLSRLRGLRGRGGFRSQIGMRRVEGLDISAASDAEVIDVLRGKRPGDLRLQARRKTDI